MWSMRESDGRRVLDVSAVDRSEFKVVSQDGLHLVCPKKNKWDWSDDERLLRSIVVNDKGEVVSCGFPKFGNYGEFQDDTEALNQALASGAPVFFSHKEDGSLCIRSVINGKVVMRTRGTMFGGDDMEDGTPSFGKRFRKVAEEKYPILLDPSYCCCESLLFEYVAPTNTVVVRYRDDDLIFLGAMAHYQLTPFVWDTIQSMAGDRGFNLVELKKLPRDPVAMLEEIKDWRTEGIVARCDGSKVMVKVKSAYYLANHRMKFSMNYKTIVEFIDTSGVRSEDELVKKLKEYDYDWEIIESAKELYAKYLDVVAHADAWVATAHAMFDEVMVEIAALSKDPPKADSAEHRKRFAMVACQQHSVVRTIMFLLYDDRKERFANLYRRIIKTEAKIKGKKT